MNPQPCFFVIPAGGSGLRFGTPLPKQYTVVAGKPIIIHTLEAVAPYAEQIVVAISPAQQDIWKTLCQKYPIAASCLTAQAGETRFLSVKSALSAIPSGVLVAIHDAVRPLISGDTIKRLLEAAQKGGAALPFTRLTDTIRELLPMAESGFITKAADRDKFLSIQTPQVFESEKLKEAYKQPFQSFFTDDCSVYEAFFAESPTLVEDFCPNLKITRPEDVALFEALRPSEQ